MTLDADCCIAGGGPAGMMLGLLLARAGVRVVVLEKHADFLRDFRGDTVHPSTLEVIHELGLLDDFLSRPHQKVYEVGGVIGTTPVTLADFRHLPTKCGFIAFMPQWDFLDFLSDHARKYPHFELRMRTKVVDLLTDAEGRVSGVRASGPEGEFDVTAALVVGADGRRSDVRRAAGLTVRTLGAPMDVLWMRIPRQPSDSSAVLGHIVAGRVFVMLQREDYWQCAYVIAKGTIDELRARGLESLRRDIVRIVPWLDGRLGDDGALGSWDDVKLLTVEVDHLEQWWRPGLLCIGDAAHAMSPMGGVGINLAIQDAVAAGNILAAPLRDGALTDAHLAAVQKRREFPARLTQRVQVFMQNAVIRNVLAGAVPAAPPLPVRLIDRFARLRRIPARLVGIGVRPEHIEN